MSDAKRERNRGGRRQVCRLPIVVRRMTHGVSAKARFNC